jgi:hypothetical protein
MVSICHMDNEVRLIISSRICFGSSTKFAIYPVTLKLLLKMLTLLFTMNDSTLLAKPQRWTDLSKA